MYEISLLKGDTYTMSSHARYYAATTKIRSQLIRNLRLNGVSGAIRAEMNTILDPIMPSYKDYLFAKDPTCKICNCPIATLPEATIDHIHPRSKGGSNDISNLQLAHGRCNVLKSDKVIFPPLASQISVKI